MYTVLFALEHNAYATAMHMCEDLLSLGHIIPYMLSNGCGGLLVYAMYALLLGFLCTYLNGYDAPCAK